MEVECACQIRVHERWRTWLDDLVDESVAGIILTIVNVCTGPLCIDSWERLHLVGNVRVQILTRAVG
jgi:hypothetical protein